MVDSRLKKIWRDLTERKGRVLLTLVGLAIGLWGIASVAVAWLVLGNDMQENFLKTNPPSIAMTIAKTIESEGPIDVASLGFIEGAEEIENRPQMIGRVQVTADKWLPFPVWVVDDFENTSVAKIFYQTGMVVPPDGEVLIERDGIYLANVMRRMRQGATDGRDAPLSELVRFQSEPMNIKLRGGRRITTEIAGTVHDPARPASRVEGVVFGYITRETASQWMGDEVVDRLIVTAAQGYEGDDAVRQTAARLGARLQELGYRVTSVDFPSATEHLHQFQIDSILFLLGGLGLLALLMSVVLILNLVNAILTSQIRQIGILKAIGASAGKVATIYLGGMVALGTVASLVAMPLAVRSGYVISDVLSAGMNFDVLTTELPVLFMAALYAAGILFPVLAALLPVRRWARVSVSDALRHFGVNNPRDKSGARLDKLLLPLSINMRMGFRNAFRKPQRTLLTAATLGIGILCFMVAMNTRSSLLHTADLEEMQKNFDVVVGFEEPMAADQLGWLSALDLVGGAETWQAELAAILDDNGQQMARSIVYVVPPDSTIMAPVMMAGAWLDEGRSGLVINQKIELEHPELSVGSIMSLRIGDDFLELPIIGKLKEFGQGVIYMGEADFRSVVPSAGDGARVAFITLDEATERNLAALMLMLQKRFDAEGINVTGITSAKIASRILRNHLDIIVAALLIVAMMMLFVGSLGMASGISSSVVERTREIGILRAIGGKPGAIRTILCSEALVMALIGWLAAVVLAPLLSRFLTEYFGTALVEYPFDYKGSFAGIYLGLAATLAIAALATLAPAAMAIRQSVKDAISYE